MAKYPYQNLSLENIKGERWKDIPGLELYFKVSNYGRVKRLKYELQYIDGRVYLKPEKIIKPVVTCARNNFMNDTISFLCVGVTLYKKKYNFTINRLVYHCFVKPFPLNDSSILILNKDRNGLNIKPSNLKIASRGEKQKRIFNLDRRAPLVIGEEARQKAIAKLRWANNKQVTQYNLDGKKIKTFKSVAEAAKKTGINSSHISARANGVEFSAGGFIWRFGNKSEIDMVPMLLKIEQRRKSNKDNFGKKVTQYKMNGERVDTFPTINDAAKATGLKNSEISNVVHRKRYSAGGFYWYPGFGPAFIDLADHQFGEKLRAKRIQKPVEQYSKEGKYLQTFDSVKKASKTVGVNSTTVTGALRGKQLTAGGYKWKYAKRNFPL